MELELTGTAVAEIDGLDALARSLSEEQPVEAFVATLKRELVSRGFLPVELLLEGEAVTSDLLATLGERPASTFDALRVGVVDVRSFLEEVFTACGQSVSKLLDLTQQISQYVRTGKTSQALEALGSLAEELSCLISAYRNGLGVLRSCDIAASSDVVEADRVLNELEVALREVLQGVTQADHILISDVLEYVLPDHLEALREGFGRWSRILDDTTSPAS